MERKIYKLISGAKQSLFALALIVSGRAHSQATYSFAYTGAVQTMTLPAGIWGIECWGGNGGDITLGPGGGGKGGYSKGAYNISVAGTQLNILVGGKGGSASGTGVAGNGGWNGGGGGGYCGKSGAGGGGATDVRVGGLAASNRVIVAGGGGGASWYNLLAIGGNGGAQAGGYGDITNISNVTTPGGGAAGAVGGSPGLSNPFFATSDGSATGGGGGGNSPTGFGQPGIGGGPGGLGGTTAGGLTGGSGGGGGGYAGGAGGSQTTNAGVGGGGGSGYIGGVNNGTTVATLQPGYVNNPDALGNGYVIITELCNITLVPSKNPICIGASITLSTNAVSGITWGGSGSTANSINVTPTVTTSYSVTGTSTANCSTTNVLTIVVNPLPVISVVASPTTLCVGSTATVVATGANTYTWSSGNASATTTTVTPVVNTIYIVTATSVFGCINSQTAAVVVNTNNLTMVPQATAVCVGGSANIMATGALSYTWSNGSMFQSTPVSPSVTTSYVVSATDVHACLLTNTIVVAVTALPPVTISATKTLICKGESVTLTGNGASTYTWNNGFVGSSLTFTLPVDVSYYYSVNGTDNGCSKSASITIVAAKCLGVNEINNSSVAMTVIPNPGTGLFNLQVNSGKDNLHMIVYNTLGMLIKSEPVNTGNNQLDLRNEKTGIYFIYVTDKDNNASKVIKLIKE